MTDPRTDSPSETEAHPCDAQADRDDTRSDIEQAVDARRDAFDRREGDGEPEPMTTTGDYSGNAGTGGEVKNQDLDAQ